VSFPQKTKLTSAAPTADTPFLFLRSHPARRLKTPGRFALAMTLLAVATACARSSPIEAMEVLNYGQCEGLAAGVSQVRYEDLGRIRGGALVESAEARSIGVDSSVALVALSRGPQSTPGYGFSLLEARRSADRAELTVRWIEPPPDAVLAQVITKPCLVIAIPRTGITRVTAIDTAGQPIGEVELKP